MSVNGSMDESMGEDLDVSIGEDSDTPAAEASASSSKPAEAAAATSTSRGQYSAAAESDNESAGYSDASFGNDSADNESEPAGGGGGGEAAETPADGMGVSERVQYFLKRSSLAAGKMDDMRLEATPIFFEYLQKKRLRDWNEAECVIWLSHIGLERYRNAFFHNHVTGKTLENMTSEKLRSDVGITSLGHRELLLDEIEDFKAKNNEVLKRLKKSRSEQRQLEKFEERKLEQMQMEFLRLQVEHKDTLDAVEKAKAAEKLKAVEVDQHREKLNAYKEELKEKKKDQALQNYGKISDLNQCTFQPLLTETSLKYAQENPRGAIWDRLEQDQNEAKRNLEEASAQEQARVSGSAMRDHLHEARLYIMAAVGKDGQEFSHDHIKTALELALADRKVDKKDMEAIEKKPRDEKLLAAFNVLRYRQFLVKYESDLRTRGWTESSGGGVSRKKPTDAKKKEKISKDEREQRQATAKATAERLCPKPLFKEDGKRRKMTAEERKRHTEQKRVQEDRIQTFLDSYEEDLHRRRINVKQARRRAKLADEQHARQPRMDRKSLLGV